MANSIRICSVPGCDKQLRAKALCAEHYSRALRHHGDPLAGRAKRGSRVEWLKSLIGHAGDDCVFPPAEFGPRRYRGWSVKIGGKKAIASRYLCELAHGPAPTDQHYDAAHNCGQGHVGCLNPNHLRWATPKENQADRVAHGTDMPGMKNVTSKLTDDQVREIRRVGYSMHKDDLGAMYGVTGTCVWYVIEGYTWKHLL